MKLNYLFALAATFGMTASATAQQTNAVDAGNSAVEVDACELHVWPTRNYLSMSTGLLIGFGAVGAVADLAVHSGQVKTVKGLMAEYLDPDAQMAELNRLRLGEALKLNGYRVIVEEPTPFNEDFKVHPELKARAQAMAAKIKAKERLTDSKSACYAELVTGYVFYQKAAMYGSNLFTYWTYRQFGSQSLATKTTFGQVKNPLENFPPKTDATVEAAKLELREAFGKDFVEYVQKKVMP